MTTGERQTEFRSLSELNQLADELIDPFKKEGVYSTKELLMKALECIEVFKGNIKADSREKEQEGAICYCAASKLLSVIIPKTPQFSELKSDKELWQFFNDLVDYLVRKRGEYDRIRQTVTEDNRQSFSNNTDSLIERFQNLKRSGNHNIEASRKLPTPLGTTPSVSFEKFRNRSFITMDELETLLHEHNRDVLIIDFRRKKEFDLDHISAAEHILQLEPLSVRGNYTCKDIEDYSMVTNSDLERQLFLNRSEFAIVVCMDSRSTKSSISYNLQQLVQILRLKSSGKPLKQPPLILDGGFSMWEFEKKRINRPDDARILQSRSSSSDGYISTNPVHADNSMSYSDEQRLIHNVSDYFSRRKSSGSFSMTNQIPAPQFKYVPTTKARSLMYSSTLGNRSTPSVSSTVSRSWLSFQNMNTSKPQTQLSNLGVSSSVNLPQMPQNTFHSAYLGRGEADFTAKGMSTPPAIPNKPPAVEPPPIGMGIRPDCLIMTGLVNLKNSCYMNSGLQCLLGSEKLVAFFLMGDYRRHINVNSRLGSKGILANEFASLTSEMYRLTNVSHPTYFNPVRFRRVLGSLNSLFNHCDQQDCSEFLTYVLDTLHEDLNENGNHPKLPELSKQEEQQRESLPIRVASTIEWERYLKTNFSVIVDIFEGQMMSQLKCLTCGSTSTTYNSFGTLSLPIPESVTSARLNLEDCFDEFVKPEILDGDDRWMCPVCKSKQRSSKQLRISRLPQVLCVHLKRFRMDRHLSKIDKYIKYDEYIKLDKYWPPISSNLERTELEKLPVRGQMPPFNYKLFGVINHYGNLVNGHYTAYVRKGTHGWCLFDDQNVHKHCKLSKVINGDAYILFYERC